MKKTRPNVILSPNEMIKYLQTIVVAPMISSSKPYPTRVEVRHKTTKGWISVDQFHTINRIRIVKRLKPLTHNEIEKVKIVIQEIFADSITTTDTITKLSLRA
jgi:mRNA interferase MazF